jgi:hydrogenase/urease accessory protein HupE
VLVLLLLATGSAAHESRPGYLELMEAAPGTYALNWKVPRLGSQALAIAPELPEHCGDAVPPVQAITTDGLIVRRTLDCGNLGLEGQEIRIDGLSASITDVLARVTLASGETQTVILKPDKPAFVVASQQSTGSVFAAYLTLGIEHILFGIDHLLFVLGLLLLVNGLGLLVKTITAFTLAHSITLGAAALDLVRVPQAPVEAVIALSILFLATELVKQRRGQIDIAERQPWLVALTFGLLHGFGFAGALAEIGLPQSAIPLALFSFNLGVEVGQLLFVFTALLAIAGLQRLPQAWPAWAELIPAYGIGCIAAFWCIQRVAGF